MLRYRLSLLLTLYHCAVFSGELKGKVISEIQSGVPYATVFLNGTNYGTVTDADGYFRMSDIANGNYLLKASCLGYNNVSYSISVSHTPIELIIHLEEISTELDDISVKADTYKKEVKEQSITTQRVDRVFLEESPGTGIMQNLKSLPGVSAIETGSGIAKPVIRGMSFNRVVIVNNGLKQEGQQWGETHGLEVDQHSVENVEIIKGPASLMYGSDAIAGVVRFFPAPLLPKHKYAGDAKCFTNSSNETYGGAVGIKARSESLFINTHMSHQQYGDCSVPADVAEYNSYNLILNGYLKNTAGNETSAMAQLGTALKKGKTYIEISNVYQKSGFYADAHGQELRSTEIDHDASRRDINLPYQIADHFRFSHHLVWNGALKITSNVGYQRNLHTDKTELTDITGLAEDIPDDNIDTDLLLHTISGNVRLTKDIGNSVFSIGNSNQYCINQISGFSFVIPAYTKLSSGIFLHHRYNCGHELFLNSGLRYDFAQLDIQKYLNPRKTSSEDSLLANQLNKNFHSYTGMVGLSKQLSNSINIKINAGKSFRIPTAMELSANGMVKSAYRFEKGSNDLEPEVAYQVDFSIAYANKSVNASLSPFYSYFTNYIFLNPSGSFNSVTGAGQVYEYRQTEAVRQGYELQCNYLNKSLGELSVSAEYVQAINLANNYPLPFTPPFSMQSGIKLYLLKKSPIMQKTKLLLGHRYQHSQKKVVQNEKTTPSSNIFSCGIITQPHFHKVKLKIILNVQNILNTKYYNHLSVYRRLEIPEAGRSVHITLSVPFGAI